MVGRQKDRPTSAAGAKPSGGWRQSPLAKKREFLRAELRVDLRYVAAQAPRLQRGRRGEEERGRRGEEERDFRGVTRPAWPPGLTGLHPLTRPAAASGTGLARPARSSLRCAGPPWRRRRRRRPGCVVMQGMPCETAAARMRPSSVRAPLPLGVLITSRKIAVAACSRARWDAPRWIFFSGCTRCRPPPAAGPCRGWPAARSPSRSSRRARSATCSLRPLGDADEDLAARWATPCRPPSGSWQKRWGSCSLTPITSPVDFISGPKHDVDAGELGEGEDGLLDRERAAGIGSSMIALLGQRHARHHLGRRLGQRHARGLRDKGHRAAGPRIDLQHVDDRPAVLAFHGELDVHQPLDLQLAGPWPRWPRGFPATTGPRRL